MTDGLFVLPASTLVDRALLAMAERSRQADWLAANILGLTNAPGVVAERLTAALLGADPRVHRLADGSWSLVACARGVPMLDECSFAVVDVETTGGSSRIDDRITEIAIVLVCGERRELLFESLINPGRPIPGFVSSVTGITDHMVRAAPRFEEVVDRVLDALSGRVFVAHNVRFDWAFVASELKRSRGIRLDGPRLCTVRLARRLVPSAGSCSLGSLSYFFGLENQARHRAAGDALVTAQLLQRLMGMAREKGARTLADLELLQGPGKRPGTRKKKKRSALPTDMI